MNNDEEKDAKEDVNRNGIDDKIEPPIPDVAAGTRRLAERLLNNQAMDPTLSGGDLDEGLNPGEKERSRDTNRWELDPASSEGYGDRGRGGR